MKPREHLVRDWAIGLAFIALVLWWSTIAGKDLDKEQRIKDHTTTPTTLLIQDPPQGDGYLP
jgi:hypothetical protein